MKAEKAEVERLRRPHPERTGPKRSFADLAQAAGAPSPAPSREDQPERAQPQAGEMGGDPGPAAAVNLGYRVIEDYLRQGQDAARLLGPSMVGSLGVGGFQDISERLLRDGLIWLEHMAKVWGALDPPAPAGSTPPAPGSEDVPRSDVRVRIASALPAEVQVRLQPGAAQHELHVQDLRSPVRSAPSIEGIVLARLPDDGTLRVDIRVPDAVVPGVYSGTVVDAGDGAVLGTIAVRVDPPESPA